MEELVSCRESLVREDEREVLRVLMTMMLVLSFVFLILMAEQPNLWAAAAFYLIYPIGLIYFSVAPRNGALSWSDTLLAAAVFGFIAYATYDLSNLATLKGWPTHLAFIDIVWGTVLSTLAAAGGKAAFDWTAAQALR